jgi:hypothetical protein
VFLVAYALLQKAIPREARRLQDAFNAIVSPFERLSLLCLTPQRYLLFKVLPMYPALHEVKPRSASAYDMVLCHASGLRGVWATPASSKSVVAAEGKTRASYDERDFYGKMRNAESDLAKKKRANRAIIFCSSFGYQYVQYKPVDSDEEDEAKEDPTYEEEEEEVE